MSAHYVSAKPLREQQTMSVLIFRLNGVGDNEAQDVRELFDNNNISYYETNAGRWGISVAALWLNDKTQLEDAKALLAHYQQQRLLRIQSADDDDPEYGKPLSFTQRLVRAPLQYLLLIAAILAILYISIIPFISIS